MAMSPSSCERQSSDAVSVGTSEVDSVTKDQVAWTKALLLVIGADADIARKTKEANKGSRTRQAMLGDWTCPSCKDIQFARNKQCRMCQTPRPEGGSADLGEGKSDTARGNGVGERSKSTPPARLNAPNWQQWGSRDEHPSNNGGRQCPPPQKLAQLLLTKKRIRGVVKGYNKATEFGFIVGEEVDEYLGHGCNVFLHRTTLDDPEAASTLVGAEVSFVVKLTYEGKPQAREVKVERQSTTTFPRPSSNVKSKLCVEGITNQHAPDKMYHGRVKSFDEASGYGFIACAETRAIFGRDVFLHRSRRAGFAVGDAVSFLIDVDPVRGSPKARDLIVAPESANVPALEQLVDKTGMSTPPLDVEIGSSQSTRSPQGSDDVATDLYSPDGQVMQAKEQSACLEPDTDCGDPWSRGNDPWCKREDSSSKERLDPWCSGGDPWSSKTSVRTRSKEVCTPSRVSESVVGESVKMESACTSVEISSDLVSPDVIAAVADDAESSKAAPSSQKEEVPLSEGTVAENIVEQPTPDRIWERYLSDDGTGAWWWCPADGSWFMEEDPAPWCKYMDPTSERCYWYKDDEHASFWADSGSIVA